MAGKHGPVEKFHNGRVERFHKDELIVPISQLDAVRGALPAYVTIGHTEKNAALGLARLSGLDLGPSELDRVIRDVKAKLADEYPGWQIVIGKNYVPSTVQSDPHTDGAGRPLPHTDAVGYPDPHTDGAGHPDPHTDGTGKPTVTGADCAGPIVPDPHTDIERKRAGAGQPGWGMRVGLVDTKLFPHQSLAGHYYLSRPDDLLSPSHSPYTELDGHGTFVASCILRQAPGALLCVRHGLDQDGVASAWHVAVSIAELAPLGLDVVNLSFGEYMTDDDSAPMVLDAAIRLFGRDTVVVASAGNNGDAKGSGSSGLPQGVTPSTTSYPAASPGVVAVGALNAHDDERADFTPYPAPWISLLARGVKVNAAYLHGQVQLGQEKKPTEFKGFANWSGCSFAAAVVSGIIAARTEPGRRTAREALDELVESLHEKPWDGLSINPELLIK